MPLRLELEIFTYAKGIERTVTLEESGMAVFFMNSNLKSMTVPDFRECPFFSGDGRVGG